MHRDAREILNRLKVDVNSVYQKVESLSGGRQQSVAIARAISFNPKVVIFDEPTANLSGPATERLLETIVELKNHGVAQIIISHRLTDIFEVGDRVMVLKRGRNVGVRDVAATSEKEVLELIVSGVPETPDCGRGGDLKSVAFDGSNAVIASEREAIQGSSGAAVAVDRRAASPLAMTTSIEEQGAAFRRRGLATAPSACPP